MSKTTFAVAPLGQRDGLCLRRCGVRLGKMGSGHHNGARASDQGFVDVALIQRHVRAIGPIEDGRRDAFGFHREQHQTAQAVLVGVNPLDVDALAGELFPNEAAHLFGADTRDQAPT